MKTIYTTALLALSGIAATAQAQVSAAANDLILGFHATGGQGVSVSLEVDLGSISNFTGLATGTSLTLSRLAVADLAATYGNNWASRTDLFWGVVGTSGRLAAGPGGQPADTLWATAPESTIGTQSTPYTPGGVGAQAVAASLIEPLYVNAPGSLNGATATSNSAQTAAIVATLSGSFAAQDASQPGVSFGFFNPTVDNAANVPSTGFAVSDLYELRPGASSATYLGSFGLSSTGLVYKSTLSNYLPGAPVITAAPVTTNVAPGGSTTLSVTATGATPLTYQWYDNGTAIAGATSSTYTISNAGSANAGSYTVAVSNSVSTVRSSAATVAVTTVSTLPHLINLSVNTTLAVGEQATVGFVVGGGSAAAEPILVRADGPSLAGLVGPGTPVVDDPKESYYNGSTLVSSNDNWGVDATTIANITAISAQVGAFPLASSTSKDAALYIASAASGLDSVIITNGGTVSGTMVAEIYDATASSAFVTTSPRLVNVSVQKNMGSGVTVGFTIGGSGTRNVLIRATGPTLGAAPFNVPNTAADPQLTLYSGTTVIATNNDWSSDASKAALLSTAFTATSAFPLPSGSKDAAILMGLQPGVYSVLASPNTGTATGTVLVEVYEAP